jgi:hypothetical protein
LVSTASLRFISVGNIPTDINRLPPLHHRGQEIIVGIFPTMCY